MKTSNSIKYYQYPYFKTDEMTDTRKIIELYELYGRIGDEFYIPEEINNYILDTDKKYYIIATVDDDTINVKRTNLTMVGGMQNAKLKRKIGHTGKTRNTSSRNSVKTIHKRKTKAKHHSRKLIKQN